MAKITNREQRRHVREKSIIDHVARELFDANQAPEKKSSSPVLAPPHRRVCRWKSRFAKSGIRAKAGYRPSDRHSGEGRLARPSLPQGGPAGSLGEKRFETTCSRKAGFRPRPMLTPCQITVPNLPDRT